MTGSIRQLLYPSHSAQCFMTYTTISPTPSLKTFLFNLHQISPHTYLTCSISRVFERFIVRNHPNDKISSFLQITNNTQQPTDYKVVKPPLTWMKCFNKSWYYMEQFRTSIPSYCSTWTRVTYYKHRLFLIIKLSIETRHSPQVKTFPSAFDSSTEKV